MDQAQRLDAPSWQSERARVANLSRYRADDDPDLADARRDLRAARAVAYIQDLIASAPPLTAEQRDKLAVLLRSSAA